jgi:hypothetical protein
LAGAIQLTEVDFDQIKLNLVNYLKSTKQFTAYDFSGSNLQVILNLVAYQSQLNAYSTNMIANESFLSSATLRDNVVSNAKSVGYIPNSTKSAQSEVTFTFQLESVNFPSGFPLFLDVRPGMVFSTSTGSTNYIFNIVDAQTAPVGSAGLCTFNNVTVYEGTYLTDEFTVDTANYNQKFVLENRNIDTSLIRVEVQENPNQEARTFFQQANNLVTTTAESAVYWIEEASEQYYEMTFGDGYFGKKLLNGAKIFVSYLVSNGSGANGIQAATNFTYTGRTFTSGGVALNKTATITSASVTAAGSQIESVEEIKFRAPKFYSAQNRAVTNSDYKTLVQNIYPAASDVYVYGGEELDIPEYGRVFIAIKPNTGETLSNVTKNSIVESLDEFRVSSIGIIIVDPSILYLELDTTVFYDDTRTIKDNAGIISSVKSTLDSTVVSGSIDKFGGAARFSRILTAIDAADTAITRNTTTIKMRKDFTVVENTPASYEICFEQGLELNTQNAVIGSTGFTLLDDTTTYYFEDDTKGNIYTYYFSSSGAKTIKDAQFGTIDYVKGEIMIGYTTAVTFASTILPGSTIQVRAIPLGQDVVAKKSVYLDLDVDNSKISAVVDTNALSS